MRAAGIQGLSGRQFVREEMDRLWVTGSERHEALFNRAVVNGHRLRPVAAGRRTGVSPTGGTSGRVDSSPDDAGTWAAPSDCTASASTTRWCM